MSALYIHTYQTKLLELNENLYHIYIESHKEFGGGRDITFLRQHDRGVPITLRDNFSEQGSLTPFTEARDMAMIDKQFQTINYSLNYGKILCVPIYPLTDELTSLEKQSPKMAEYVYKKIKSFNWIIQNGRM
jgi:hypothetical protein|tara:strand:+ start:2373 stop:2768 length:396 start_codon:yes stop_codon:yes gene_type:complete